jgi:hypothetical protein
MEALEKEYGTHVLSPSSASMAMKSLQLPALVTSPENQHYHGALVLFMTITNLIPRPSK